MYFLSSLEDLNRLLKNTFNSKKTTADLAAVVDSVDKI